MKGVFSIELTPSRVGGQKTGREPHSWRIKHSSGVELFVPADVIGNSPLRSQHKVKEAVASCLELLLEELGETNEL